MKFKLLSLVVMLSMLPACSKAPPVPISECDKVVSHAKKVLGAQAPSHTEMTAQCKAASDEARGCVMQADKPMKILKCDM